VHGISRAAILAILVVGLCGCTTIPDRVVELPEFQSSVEIDSTPFYPQERFHCGPAALTTLLRYSGVDVSLDAVTQFTYIPDQKGSLQVELLATARSFERIPYRVDGTMTALVAELEAGRPVLVLQNLGVSWYPRWHYAVVIGIDAESNEVLLRSGTEMRRVTSSRTFARTWQRGDYWAVILLEPGQLPANPDRQRYISAVADVEAAGHLQAAMQAWTAALDYWPNDRLAMFGKANTAFQLGDLQLSEHLYRRLITDNPDMHAARNNFA
jgi:tetratricopeptide (TPR) repeat protein